MATPNVRFDPKSPTARICRALQADGVPQAKLQTRESIWDTALQRYERYQKTIEGITRQPLPWAIDDLNPLTHHDLYLRTSAQQAIRLLKKILRKQGFRPGTPEYEERLAVAIFYFGCAPSPLMMHAIKKDIAKIFPVLENLRGLGLNDFYQFILENGGWGLSWLDYPGGIKEEVSGLEAFQKGIGACTEVSKLLFALFRMAGLKSQIVFMPAQGAHDALHPLLTEQPKVEVWGHVAVGLNWNNRWRYFDAQNGALSDAPFHAIAKPLSLREYYFADLGNQVGAQIEQGKVKAENPLLHLADEFGQVRHIGERFHVLRAILAMEKDKTAEAKQWLQKGLSANPDSIEVPALLTSIYLREKNCAEASGHFKTLMADPNGQQLALSGLYFCNPDGWAQDPSWLNIFREGVERNPLNADLRGLYGSLLLFHQRYPEALEEVHHLIYLNPIALGNWDGMIHIKLAQNRLEEVREIADQLGEAFDQLPSAHLVRTLEHWRAGEPEESASTLERYGRFLDRSLQENRLPIHAYEISRHLFADVYPQAMWEHPSLKRAALQIYTPIVNKADVLGDWKLVRKVAQDALRLDPANCFFWKERYLAEKNLGLTKALPPSCRQMKKACGKAQRCQ